METSARRLKLDARLGLAWVELGDVYMGKASAAQGANAQALGCSRPMDAVPEDARVKACDLRYTFSSVMQP